MKSILVKNYSAIENSLRYYLHKDIEIRYMSSHNSSFIEYKLFSYSTMNPYNPPSVVRPLFLRCKLSNNFPSSNSNRHEIVKIMDPLFCTWHTLILQSIWTNEGIPIRGPQKIRPKECPLTFYCNELLSSRCVTVYNQ